MKQIKACLFDMDGLLISSEDVYTESFSTILRQLGCPQGLTWDTKLKMQGKQGLDACQILVDDYHLEGKITNKEILRLTSEEQLKLWPTVRFLPGALELLKYLKAHNIPIALCTSSSLEKYHLKTANLQDGFKLFGDKIVTGDNKAVIGKSKPMPDIWLEGLRLINLDQKSDIKPDECLVFEDAFNGFISGNRAGSFVIWVPDPHVVASIGKDKVDGLTQKGKYAEVLGSLEEFKPTKYGL